MKYKRHFVFSVYNWGVIIAGIPFVSFFVLTGIASNNIYLILATAIPIFIVYYFLVRENYYFALTSNKLIILNDLLPWKKQSFRYDQISKVKDDLVSIIITTNDNRVREFRTCLSAKKINRMLKDMQKKAPGILYEDWNSHRNKR